MRLFLEGRWCNITFKSGQRPLNSNSIKERGRKKTTAAVVRARFPHRERWCTEKFAGSFSQFYYSAQIEAGSSLAEVQGGSLHVEALILLLLFCANTYTHKTHTHTHTPPCKLAGLQGSQRKDVGKSQRR